MNVVFCFIGKAMEKPNPCEQKNKTSYTNNSNNNNKKQ